MRKYLPVLIAFLLINVINAQELPFSDNFENDIDGWTLQNTISNTQWYWNNEEGFEGTNSASFTLNLIKPYDVNDAWFVTSEINTDASSHVKIKFKYMRWGDYLSPQLYYTYNFTGDVETTEWNEIQGIPWGTDVLDYYDIPALEIETPGNKFWFAFRYQTTEDKAAAFYVDNFSIGSYIPPAPFILVGEAEHFEFYTNISGEEDFYLTIQDNLEEQYDKLSSLWNRPGIEDIFKESDKIKVYYSAKNDIYLAEEETPGWKSGFHNPENLELFLSPLTNSSQLDYYSTLAGLAVNEFSQLAVSKKLLRDNWSDLPSYFLEGFGLYETGFRPRRDSITKYIDENPATNFDFATDTSGISNTLKKDFIVSCVEGPLLSGGSYLGIGPVHSSWLHNQLSIYLKYFYTEPENQRIKLQLTTPDFDFYGATSDSSHFSELVSYFEDAYSFYITNYNFKPKHRFKVVIVPTEPIGMDILNYDDYFNGGVGCGGDLVIQLSPNYNFDQETYDKYYANTSSHEFFHVYYNHFMWEIPGGFWAEGSADFSARHALEADIHRERFWMIEWTFDKYAKKYNVELDLEHISTNPNLELDIYYLGDLFFEFLYQNYGGYENIKKFFNQGMDYSVFGTTYEEIDTGYINYLKSLAGIATKTDLAKNSSSNNLSLILTDEFHLSFQIPTSGRVNLSVFDIQGRKICTLIDKKLSAGKHIVSPNNPMIVNGTYIYKLTTSKNSSVLKFIKN
ncbi:T9SS type A sorting domain-containing protein [Maribellus maritimus]|uniref:T9SS type A sorting domain-containing protein n=1 Tax=Maribellus maritimus TaxID=2870838 RepID=UPI001EEC25AC|nr:T9SS type A sorting domain-containing protein [Maribellus maritimus]MCG6187532.1 T9SS type A sorting domain-containing protein [Maribellus maritimus]